MPTKKQVVTAHFKGLSLKSHETVNNAIVIPWISPEQEYYVDINYVAALVDLLNKTFDFNSSEVHTVIAGYLQRFNFYRKKFEEIVAGECDLSACQAMALGEQWYEEKKRVIKCLDPSFKHLSKIFWQQILFKEQYKAAKKHIDGIYASNPQYQTSFRETSELFFKSKASKEGAQLDKELFVHNSQEYLREECAFLYALPQLYSEGIKEGRQIYIVYPRGASPAIRATIDLTQELYPNTIHWLCADLKVRNTEKFDLQQFLAANPHCGCSSSIVQLTQARVRRRGTGISLFSSQPVLNPQTLNPALLAEADDEWSRFVKGSMLLHATQSAPKDDLPSHLSKFFVKLMEMSDKNSESGSSSPLSPLSSSSESGDEGGASSAPKADALIVADTSLAQ